MRIFLPLTVAVWLLGPNVSNANAQMAGSVVRTRIPVTVVLSNRLPPASRFIVQRSPSPEHRDVIMLAEDANEAELGAAIVTLLKTRQRGGDSPSQRQTLRIRPERSSILFRPAFPWVGRVLSDLRRADRIELEGVGSVRAVKIWLPAQTSGRLPKREPRT